MITYTELHSRDTSWNPLPFTMQEGLHWLTLCQGPQLDSDKGGWGPGESAEAPEIARRDSY